MSIERVDHNKANQLLNIGRLVDVQWKLGFAMSSNDCRNLNSPYITMVMKVIESSGSICSKSFEMSISEFKTFSNQVKDIANTLETV